jgi:drug/metabolite transporter (DMT)-like permease
VIVPAALIAVRRSGGGPPRAWGRQAPVLRVAAVSALFLALHLGTWIASLSYTSIASSTVLVTTTPIMLTLMPARWRGDPLTARAVVGVLIAFAGGAAIAFGDAGVDLGMAVGDALALAGAAAMVGHRTTGRQLLRAGLPPLTFLAVVYPVAALALAAVAIALGQPLAGFNDQTYLALAALGLVPQLIGHSALNWALTRLSAVSVATAVTGGEPLGATLLGMVLLNEVPTVSQAIGGTLVLGGTYMVLREERYTQSRG